MEVAGFVELREEYRDRGVLFVGLSVDEDGFEAVRPYAEEQGLNYPQLASRQVAYRDYGTKTSVPRTYVIDRRGQIRTSQPRLTESGP